MAAEGELRLRPFRAEDLDQVEAWSNDWAFNGEFNTFGLLSAGHWRRGFAEHGYLGEERGVLIAETAAGEIAGHVSYRARYHGPPPSRAYEIGITLAPQYRGKGYGVAAQRQMAAYLFATYAIARVEATTDVENLAEQRALTRAGFTREGVLRHAQWRGGVWRDMVIYSKLRGE